MYCVHAEITTVEGILRNAIDDLKSDQEARKTADLELYTKLENFIQKLEALFAFQEPFLLIVSLCFISRSLPVCFKLNL